MNETTMRARIEAYRAGRVRYAGARGISGAEAQRWRETAYDVDGVQIGVRSMPFSDRYDVWAEPTDGGLPYWQRTARERVA